jgi:hypothetical protein
LMKVATASKAPWNTSCNSTVAHQRVVALTTWQWTNNRENDNSPQDHPSPFLLEPATAGNSWRSCRNPTNSWDKHRRRCIYNYIYKHASSYIHIYPLATNSIIFAKTPTVESRSSIRYENCILCRRAPANELPGCHGINKLMDGEIWEGHWATGSCLAVPSLQ